MSHTNQTPKLQLAQFVANDKPTWLGDWNSTMLTIDNAVGTVQEDMSTAQGTVAQLSNEVETLTTEIDKVKPDNTGIDGNVLKKTNTGATWSSLEASNISYSNTNVDTELTKVNNTLSLIGTTDKSRSDSINVANSSPTVLAQLTLDVGSYIVIGSAQFSSNSNGIRTISISTDTQPSTWHEGRMDLSASSAGTTKMSVSRIMEITTPTTIYCVVSHNSGTTLACYGALQYIKVK